MFQVLLAVLILFSLVGYALLWSKILRLPFALTLVSACSGICVVLYFCALNRFLAGGQIIVMLCGVGALIAWIAFTPATEIKREILAPGPVAFLIGYIVLYVVTRGLLLIVWDEFSHWGAISKVLLLTDALPRAPGSVYLMEYPPGDALFQYFVAKRLAYTEGNMLFGHAILQLAAILTLVSTLRWRDFILGAALLAICSVAGFVFGAAYANWTSLLLDVEIAFLFGSTLSIYLFGGAGVRSMLCAVPVVAALTLVKEVGFLFSAMFATMVLIDMAVSALWNGTSVRSLRPASATAYALLVIVPIAIKVTWDKHLSSIGAIRYLDISWQKIQARSLQPEFAQTVLATLAKFGEAVQNKMFIGNVGFGSQKWGGVLLLLAGATLVAQRGSENRLRIFTFQALLLLFCAIYCLLILFYYIAVLSSYEAVRLGGFGRYVGTFLTAWIFMSFVMMLHDARDRIRYWLLTTFVLLLTVQTIDLTWQHVKTAFIAGPRGDEFSKEMMGVRNEVKNRLENYVDVIPTTARVYVIWNGTMGLPYGVSTFELRPRRVNPWACFSLGSKRFDGDIWSCDWTPEEFRKRLEDYDFVYLGYAEDVFWTRYGSLFALGSREERGPFFRIDNSIGQGLLYPVPGSK